LKKVPPTPAKFSKNRGASRKTRFFVVIEYCVCPEIPSGAMKVSVLQNFVGLALSRWFIVPILIQAFVWIFAAIGIQAYTNCLYFPIFPVLSWRGVCVVGV